MDLRKHPEQKGYFVPFVNFVVMQVIYGKKG